MQTTSSQIKSNFRALGILTKSHSAIDQNRLSDYLFVLARFINKKAGIQDTEWTLKKL